MLRLPDHGALQYVAMPETPLQLQCDQDGHLLSLTLHTRVLGPDGARALIKTIDDAYDTETPPTIVRVHLGDVTLMTSAAIGAIIVLHKRLAANKQHLELTDLTPAVLNAFEFLKLDRVLTISAAH